MAGASRRELELRRQQLLIRSAELRSELALQLQPLATPLAWVDQLRDGWRWLMQHPEVTLPAVAVLVVLRPSRVLTWASRAWWLWGVVRRGQSLLAGLRR
jgi:hypothetical protein